MPDEPISEYNQESFVGGMNLLGDDTRLQPNQYRIGFNLTNRFDELDPVLQSMIDPAFPQGIVQELVTFGNYLIAFVSGNAWYRSYLDTGWTQIPNFSMSQSAPRYWTVAIPVSTTNYVRIATNGSVAGTANPSGGIQTAIVAGAAFGNLPGLLVQDNQNQPQFIFLDSTGKPTTRVTQSYIQWHITYTDATNVTVAKDAQGNFLDFREYVPIGNTMAWVDGILYIASVDGSYIYRSVSGRPLDFVVNVPSGLATNAAPIVVNYTDPITSNPQTVTYPPFTLIGGGDATTTSYSVGVEGITTLRPLSTGGLFVSASIANFSVTLNQTPGAPTLFGEYTFIRKFLFNANCLSDRGIFDSLGDTRFIDLTGVRSFNAIEQAENEGRNSPFTATIQKAFLGIVQDASNIAGILFDNYELYAMSTIFGPAIAKFDTINQCWTSFDVNQTGGKRVKILAKIELAVQRLYAVTEDNQLYLLYGADDNATAAVRTIGICANTLYANQNIKLNNPRNETQLKNARIILNNILVNDGDETPLLTFTPYVNNRLTAAGTLEKPIVYKAPSTLSTDPLNLPDVNSLLRNELFSIQNCAQGWKMFGVFTWNVGSVTQYSFEMQNQTPMQPLRSRAS